MFEDIKMCLPIKDNPWPCFGWALGQGGPTAEFCAQKSTRRSWSWRRNQLHESKAGVHASGRTQLKLQNSQLWWDLCHFLMSKLHLISDFADTNLADGSFSVSLIWKKKGKKLLILNDRQIYWKYIKVKKKFVFQNLMKTSFVQRSSFFFLLSH